MDSSRLTLTNRPENLKLLLDFVQKWAKKHGLPHRKLDYLVHAAGEIFRHLLDHAYQPGEPGSIAVELTSKGPRLRLMFEDDALPSNNPEAGRTPAGPPSPGAPHFTRLLRLVESLIYYRTADRKNRLVVFLN